MIFIGSRSSSRRRFSRSRSRSNDRSHRRPYHYRSSSKSRSNSRSLSYSRSASRSVSRSISRSISRSGSKSVSRSISRSVSRSISRSSSRSRSSSKSNSNNKSYQSEHRRSYSKNSSMSHKSDNSAKSNSRLESKNNSTDENKNRTDEEIQIVEKDGKKVIKETPSFGLSGALQKDKNTGLVYKGVVMKWAEPADAAKPNIKWMLFEIKDGNIINTLYLHRCSAFLFGRDDRVCDKVLQHASISKQHAVIQFRKVPLNSNDKGDFKKMVIKPYIMDLDSANGTFLNNKRIESSRYIELKVQDEIIFGASTRSYVLLNEQIDPHAK
ncbi:hypothetical protein WA158_005504 [Blastocystis sp. Blastoise]